MAFLLRDLPDDHTLERFAADYPQLDRAAVAAFLRVLRAGSDLLAQLDDVLAPFGLTHGRWITLVLLRREPNGRALPSSLAAKQGVTRATISGLLARLEADGLVRRRRSEADARQSAAELTPKGRRLLDRVMPRYYDQVAEWMRPLEPAEQRAIADMLDRLRTPTEP
jgi:DNA-binding MarR family transcriptional regulator